MIISASEFSWVEQASRLLNWASRPIPSLTRGSSNSLEQPKHMAGAKKKRTASISFRDKTHACTNFGGTPKSTGETPVPPETT